MTLPKTHNEQIKARYEALLGDDSKVAISSNTIPTDKRSLKQILRNVELLTKAIISYEA